MTAAPPTAERIVLFDGVCNLCNDTVRFVMARDPRGRFAFAPLQSGAGRALVAKHGLPADRLDTVVLLQDGRAFERSDAALRIAAGLGGAWPVLGALRLVPRRLRDTIYDWIARNRYRWFGRRAECAVPTPDQRHRFLA